MKPASSGAFRGEISGSERACQEDLIAEVLTELGVSVDSCFGFEWSIPKDSSRGLPYRTLVLPEIDHQILFCEEPGYRVFVINTASNPECFAAMSYEELDASMDAISFHMFNSNVWKDNLKIALNSGGRSEYFTDDEFLTVSKYSSSEYFHHPRIVQRDLEAFARKVGPDFDWRDLTVGKIGPLRIVTGHGKIWTGDTYLRHASSAFGFLSSPGKNKEGDSGC